MSTTGSIGGSVVELVAATWTSLATQITAKGKNVNLLTYLDDVQVILMDSGYTPVGATSGVAVTQFEALNVDIPVDSSQVLWAYSVAGGRLNVETAKSVSYRGGEGVVPTLLMGTGWSSGGTAYCKEHIVNKGGIIHTTLILDIIGLDSSAGTTDIIGEIGAANSWFYQVTTAKNGVVQSGSLECLVTPATGDVDIDLYSADEATGVEDAAVTGLTDDRLLANGASMALGDGPDPLALVPGPDQHLYLTGAGTTNATYTAGRFKIEMWGLAA